jgi:flagellar assembly protein FliH
MAAVIRDARIEAEGVVLALMPPLAQPRPAAGTRARREPEQRATKEEPVAEEGSEPIAAPSVVEAAAHAREEAERAAREQTLREQREREQREALERAQAEGYAAGIAQGEAKYAAQVEQLAAVLASAPAAIEAAVVGAEDVIVEIAYESVCKIVGDALGRREGVVAVVQSVLRNLREREQLVIRVAPDDLALLESHRKDLLPYRGTVVALVADERVSLGGCLVESSGGTLDGRLETQMQRLREILFDARHPQGEIHS